MLSRLQLVGTLATGSVTAVMTPLVALLTLGVSEYGIFAVCYLIFAFGVSIQYSLISEAWARYRSKVEFSSSRQEYSAVTTGLSLIVSICAFVIMVMTSSESTSFLSLSVAAGAGVYRVTTRYFTLANNNLVRILVSDSLAIVIFWAVYGFAIYNHWNLLSGIGFAWAASSTVSGLIFMYPSARISLLAAWLRLRWTTIRPLLADSILMDIGAFVAPLYLASIMTASNFAVFRGISNVVFPVRVVIDPLRARIGQLAMSTTRTIRFNLMLWVLSLVAGVGMNYGVLFLANAELFQETTLSSLARYSFEIGLFGGTVVAGSTYYILARTHAPLVFVVSGRLIQTILAVTFPFAGYLIGGLALAISGYVWAGAGGSIIWFIIFIIMKKESPRFDLEQT